MKNKKTAAIATVVTALVASVFFTAAPTQRTTPLSLIGHQHDGTVIENIVIHDTGGDGIFLRDVDNVTIRNCEIYNVSEGIAFSSLGNTKNVTIENCNIHDTGRNGIIVKQHAPTYNQTGVVIRGNTITDTGKSSTSGAYHGIYAQTEVTITGNTIDTSTGNGVSIRSSGYVGNNRISNTLKSCVRYFSDNVTGPTKKLKIENNICINPPADYPAISLLWGGNPAIVTDFTIRFNTMLGGLNSFQVQSTQFSPSVISVYGNLFNKSMVLANVDYNAGNLLSLIPLLADYSIPENHPAIGYAAMARDWPQTDINGRKRLTIDAGAVAYSAVVPVTATQTATHTPVPSTIPPTVTLAPSVTRTVTPVLPVTMTPACFEDATIRICYWEK